MKLKNINHLYFYNLGNLEAIYTVIDKNLNKAITKVAFVFSIKILFLLVHKDDKRIKVSCDDKENLKSKKRLKKMKINKKLESLFSNLSSYHALRVWSLKRKKGYKDAFQLEFFQKDVLNSQNIIFQIQALSSSLEILKPKKNPIQKFSQKYYNFITWNTLYHINFYVPFHKQAWHHFDEDLLQMDCTKDIFIDVGWYRKREKDPFYKGWFRVVVIKNQDWQKPLEIKKVKDMAQLEKVISKLALKYIKKDSLVIKF